MFSRRALNLDFQKKLAGWFSSGASIGVRWLNSFFNQFIRKVVEARPNLRLNESNFQAHTIDDLLYGSSGIGRPDRPTLTCSKCRTDLAVVTYHWQASALKATRWGRGSLAQRGHFLLLIPPNMHQHLLCALSSSILNQNVKNGHRELFSFLLFTELESSRFDHYSGHILTTALLVKSSRPFSLYGRVLRMLNTSNAFYSLRHSHQFQWIVLNFRFWTSLLLTLIKWLVSPWESQREILRSQRAVRAVCGRTSRRGQTLKLRRTAKWNCRLIRCASVIGCYRMFFLQSKTSYEIGFSR